MAEAGVAAMLDTGKSPDQVHYGQANDVYDARQATLTQAFQANPERFVNKPPQPPQIPTAVWINPPSNLLQTHP